MTWKKILEIVMEHSFNNWCDTNTLDGRGDILGKVMGTDHSEFKR